MSPHFRSYEVQVLMALYALALTLKVHAFEPETHSALSILAARNHYQSQVGEFVACQLREPRGLLTLGFVASDLTVPLPTAVFAHTYLDALGLGAKDEDSNQSFCDSIKRHRMANHFYDPSRNGMGLNDTTWLLEYLRTHLDTFPTCGPVTLSPIPQVDSLHWAWDNRGAIGTLRGDENYSWLAARTNFISWLTNAIPSERQRYAGETFYALGHVIHLVQDLAQPQHTRNDGHMPKILGGDNAPFEEYCLIHYGTPAQIAALPFEEVPEFKALPAKRPDGIPPEFRAFWNTDQLFLNRSDSPTYSSALGLAEFSNFFFVTDDTMFSGEPRVQILRGHEITSPFDFEQRHFFRWPRLSDVFGWEALLPLTPAQIEIARIGENQVVVWEKQDIRRNTPNVADFCSAHMGAELFLGLTDKNREAHARVLLPKAIAYSTGLLNYFFRGRLKMEFLYPETSGNPQLKITNLTINESAGRGESFGTGSFTLLREDPITTNRTEIAGTSINSSYPGTLEFGQSFTANLGGSIPRDGNLILVFKGTIGNETDIAVAAVVSPGLCGNFELLANGGTNTTVQAGEIIWFERHRLNADGTRTNVPVTANSWNSAYGTWRGTPINGYSETGDHPSYAFMRHGDGGLRALRRGTWTLRPNGGGCVTIVVENDLIMVGGCDIEFAIDGKGLGIVKSTGGNALGGPPFGSQHGYGFRISLSAGPHQLTMKNCTPVPGPGQAPGPCGDTGGTQGWFGFFGGVSPQGQNFNLFPKQEVTILITAPPVPGD